MNRQYILYLRADDVDRLCETPGTSWCHWFAPWWSPRELHHAYEFCMGPCREHVVVEVVDRIGPSRYLTKMQSNRWHTLWPCPNSEVVLLPKHQTK